MNQSSSLLFKLIDWSLYEGKIGSKLTKIQFCDANMSVMRVKSRTTATAKMELLVTIVKGWTPLSIVIRAPS